MTREEYEKLLKSDYWKGYSYSLIKERNFTCEDCGRRFYNERNKLQVHHLVYRDTNPWSYKPEELIVLCEECHKKRHGLLHEDEQAFHSTTTEEVGQFNNKSYYKLEDYDSYQDPYPIEPENKPWKKYILYGLFSLLFLYFAPNILSYFSSVKKAKTQQVDLLPADIDMKNSNKTRSYQTKTIKKEDNTPPKESTTLEKIDNEISGFIDQKEEEESLYEGNLKETSYEENKEEIDLQPTETAKSTKEMTTLELLEKRNHENVVKQAKRAGVSTEGTTIEILERINHANVVKQAKRAGVSTEGSTLDILERINRKNLE